VREVAGGADYELLKDVVLSEGGVAERGDLDVREARQIQMGPNQAIELQDGDVQFAHVSECEARVVGLGAISTFRIKRYNAANEVYSEQVKKV
jgi:hypothetical protein